MTDIRARLAKHNSALTVLNGIVSGGVDRISIKGSSFTLINADGVKVDIETKHLDVIILVGNPNVSQQYFAGAYDPANDKGPDCYSHNGVGPSTGCSKPQHHVCQGCPKNEWGTGKKNDGTPSEGKACAERKLLAVSVGAAKGKAYQLNVPTTSLRNLYTYIKEVCKVTHAGYPVEPYNVFTRITFDRTKMGQVLLFEAKGMVPDASLGFVADLLDSGQVVDLLSLNDKPRATLGAPQRHMEIEGPARSVPLDARTAVTPGASATDRIAAARQAQASQPPREHPKPTAVPAPVEERFAEPEPMSGDLDDLLTGAGFGFPS
jgi:hypothetical protein